MKIIDWFKKPFKKKFKVSEESKEALAKIIVDKKNPPKKKKKGSKKTYEINGVTYTVGDKVICRSSEPHPLWYGKIVEFWDNEGKWENATPRVRNNRNGKVWGVNGIIKPYSEELMNSLKVLKPLEQWNHLVPEEIRFTEEEMLRKEETFKNKVLPKKSEFLKRD